MKAPKADKSLGQHYLKDKKVINGICADFAEDSHSIIEVGPGPGAISRGLAALSKDYWVVEKDERFPPLLSEFIPTEKIVLTDALSIKWDHFIAENKLSSPVWLASNLPYNISSVLFISFVYSEKIDFMTLMFQKEVGEKIVDHPHEKDDMNSLKAFGQAFFETKTLFKVLPGAFNPPPKVDSIVISLKRREKSLIDSSEKKQYESFLRLLFSQKRKQMGNVLKSKIPAEKLMPSLQESGISPTIRAERLKLEEVVLLYNKLKMFAEFF